jgi:Lrp/AsnC family transcriptional regulator, leucine-responsive regulatory protein
MPVKLTKEEGKRSQFDGKSALALDRKDRQILAILQHDGRRPVADIAREVNLTVTPCAERVRRLEQSGLIRRYVALLDPQRLGDTLVAYVEVVLDRTTPDVFERFKEAMLALEEVSECHMVAGGFDYLLKVRVRDMEEYRRVLGAQIAAVRGVQQTHTYFVMEEVKSTHALRVRGPGSS